MKKIHVLLIIGAFTLLLVGCGRDTSKVEEAILGHWVGEGSEESHMYIDSNKLFYTR